LIDLAKCRGQLTRLTVLFKCRGKLTQVGIDLKEIDLHQRPARLPVD
jgi:hypothetical protein